MLGHRGVRNVSCPWGFLAGPSGICETTVGTADEGTTMTEPEQGRQEEHLDASEDDGSAELLPEDGGSATPPRDGKTD